jgi:MFS family permease
LWIGGDESCGGNAASSSAVARAASPRVGYRLKARISLDEQRLHYRGWRVTAASAVGLFCWSLPPYSFAVFLKPIAEELELSRAAVSSLFGAAALSVAITSGPVGYLIDRVGGRAVILPFLALAGTAFALRALLEPPLWPFVLLFALSGVAGVGSSPVGYARLLSTWFDRRRGLALGIAIAGGALGAIVHPVLAETLIRELGWRRAHVVLGSLMLAIGLPAIALFVRPRPEPRSVGPLTNAATPGVSVVEGIRSPVFWIVAVVLLCDAVANSSLAIHLSALLTDRGLAPRESALALSAMGSAAFVGRLSTGWMLDRFFAARVSFGLLLATAAGVALLSSANTFGVAVLGAFLVGFGMGGEADVTPFLLSRYFGLRSFSTLYGLSYAAVGLAWAIGPVMMGRTFDATGSYAPQLSRLVVMLLAAAALMLMLPRYTASPWLISPPAKPSRL